MGADSFQDPDGTMVSQPKKYIEKLKETYVRLFNTEPSKGLKTTLEKNDHPELDTSEILEGQEVNHYLTMVGQLQWLITNDSHCNKADTSKVASLVSHKRVTC